MLFRELVDASNRVAVPLLLAILLLVAAACGAPEQPPPNIVVILVDDLGAFDLASYGHPYHTTPNIDRLASEGLRFTQAYAAASVCAPTRAALLTGKSPARLHLTHALPPQPQPLAPLPASESGPATQRVTEPQSATVLDPREVTLAERLRAMGYTTALIGKWHLGAGAAGPEAQGFDVVAGGEEEAAPTSFFAPYGLARLAGRSEGEDLTARLADEAEAFIEANAKKPFFLLLSHFAVHTPIQADAESVRRWRERLAEIEGADPAVDGSLRPAYAAMLESLDQSVGRIVAKLAELGLEDDTIVVLTSDNGAVLVTPETGEEVTTNGPLRGGKATLYEGGLRVPLIVRWPAVVKSGAESRALTTTADWFPTLIEIAGAAKEGPSAPRSGARRDRSAAEGGELDGRSLVAVLRDGEPPAERSLHFFYPHYIPGWRHDPGLETYWNTPGAAVRSGSMKLVRRFDGADELYDLAADPGETLDLAAERPEIARALGDELGRWLVTERAHLPRPNLAYDPDAFAREIAAAAARLGRSSEWTPNGDCTTRVAGGRLTLDCDDRPFVIGPEMILRGPLRVAVAFRATGTRGAPALWYRSVAKPRFSGDRVALVAASDPAVREGRIAAAETIRQLRIDFGRGKGGAAEVDWVRVYRDGEKAPLVDWSFDQEEP